LLPARAKGEFGLPGLLQLMKERNSILRGGDCRNVIGDSIFPQIESAMAASLLG